MLVERSEKNPILKPNRNQSWEALAVFNGCPIKKGSKTYLLYRAMSLPHYHRAAGASLIVSDIGIAEGKNGVDFSNRRRFIMPEHPWEKFGCEDPRVTKLGNAYYIFYTALATNPPRADGIKVGVAVSRDLETIIEKHLVTSFNAKAMALFPEKVSGKLCAILTVHTDQPPAEICVATFDSIEQMWDERYWETWHKDYKKFAINLKRKPEDHLEVGTPPIRTKYGWLIIYSYIQNYFSGSQKIFGIEATLLDLKDPTKVIGKTRAPLFTPDEYYERIGIVPNVVFPSGMLLSGDVIQLYYGAADTTCCLASMRLSELIDNILNTGTLKRFVRAKTNPLITPIKSHSWEAKATFNPAALYVKGKVHLMYRAMSDDNTSVFGYATSTDGITFARNPQPIYVPREQFEQKLQPGNSGCEDPRLTLIDDKVYMCYTAFTGKDYARVALTSISLNNFLIQNWKWSRPVLISPPGLNDKDAAIFPCKFKGKYLVVHRSGDDMDLAFCSSLNFDGKTWLEEYRWVEPRAGMWDSKKVGIAAPPIKTEAGWVLFYHGVSNEDNYYRVGALLLDLNDPVKIIARTDEPLFEPEMDYERNGQILNVVFPCGAVLIGKKFFIYYGGGDSVVGAAVIDKQALLQDLKAIRIDRKIGK